MPYNPAKHHRKTIRLWGYDYTRPGAYFVTICTQNRECLFGEIAEGLMQLNTLGRIAAECWKKIPEHFPHTESDSFVIMPNHLHGIIRIARPDSEGLSTTGTMGAPVGARHAVPPQEQKKQNPQKSQNPYISPRLPYHWAIQNPIELFGNPIPGALSTIIRSFKSAATKGINELRRTPGARIWQRDFYEHIIRNEVEMHRIRKYIADNPVRWWKKLKG